MGNTISIYKSPDVNYNTINKTIPLIKSNKDKKNKSFIYITGCSIRGYRETMEDYYNIEVYKDFIGIGLYDGHSGDAISKKLSEEFISKLYDKLNTCKLINIDNNIIINNVITKFFIDYDKYLYKLNFKNEGSTAVILLIIKKNIYIANCGDSRCILYNGLKSFIITRDHKPSDPNEYSRIIKTNHKVIQDRIDNNINISRTFGDFVFKDNGKNINAIIPNPSLYNSSINNCKFAIMLSDGITNVVNNKTICKYIDNRLYIGDELSSICKNIIEYCLYKNSSDNMTIIIILLYKYNIDNDRKQKDILYNEYIKYKVKSILKNNIGFRSSYNYSNLISIVDLINNDMINHNKDNNWDKVGFKIPMINKYYKYYHKKMK